MKKREEIEREKTVKKWPANIAQSRKIYYDELKPRLETARALASGEREPTKAEQNDPPSTEVELRQERFEKEQRWRDSMQAWRWTRLGSGVVWDDGFDGKFKVFKSASPPRRPLPGDDEREDK